MTTEELAELFLSHLYDLAEAAPHPNFLFAVNDFAPMYGVTDKQELEKAMNFLGDRGLIILAGLDMFGGISAGITMEGSVFVEKGGETGIIERYRRDTQATKTAAPEPPATVVTVQKTQQEGVTPNTEGPFPAARTVEALLLDMADVIEREGSIPANQKRDALSDIATLKIQLSRNTKNMAVITAILNDLAHIDSIEPFLGALNRVLAAYLM